ncbi:MAG: DUF481 domain-containing protein, partial [Undibacterium sp.]|nr:DUF481 domain-containing protein [Undibacterium sp.]
AQAQATLKPDGQFRATLGLGASVSSGNTSSKNLSLNADGVRLTDQYKTSLYGNAQYARSGDTTTSEQIRLGGRQDYNLSSVMFAFGGLDFERNKFSNLKLRSQLGAGLGFHAIKSIDTTWDLFGGVAYVDDHYFNPMLIDSNIRRKYGYAGLILGEESTHKLTSTTSAKQRLTLVPNIKNGGEYRANWDAGLAVAMNKSINLNVGLSFARNTDPGVGRKKNDTLFTTGISMNFD